MLNSYKETFFRKGLLVLSLPCIASSLCLVIFAGQWLQTSQGALQAENFERQIQLLQESFSSLLAHGRQKIAGVYEPGALKEKVRARYIPGSAGMDLNMDLNMQLGMDLGSDLRSGLHLHPYPPEVNELIKRCASVEKKIDESATGMKGEPLHSNAARLTSYYSTIVETIDVAAAIDNYIGECSRRSESAWQKEKTSRRTIYFLSLAAFSGAVLVSGFLCLYFMYDMLRRMHVLAVQASSIFRYPRRPALLEGNDEFAFVSGVFDNVVARLDETRAERQFFSRIIGDNILAPANSALSIIGTARGMAAGSDAQLQRSLDENLQVVLGALERIKSFVVELCRVSTTNGANNPLILTSFNIHEEIDQVMVALAPQADAGHLEVRLDCVQQNMFSDRKKVGRLLANLLSNAIKFSPCGSCIEVIISREGAENLLVRMLDRGPGLSSDESRSIFDPYYRGQSASKKSGFGLGLSVCRDLVGSLAGQIGYKAREGGGSEFWFSLPVNLKDVVSSSRVDTSMTGSASAAAAIALQDGDESAFDVLRSAATRKFALLMLVPILCQIMAVGWIGSCMLASSQVLDRVYCHEQLTVYVGRTWLNMFSAGYCTALYLSGGDRDLGRRARRCITEIRNNYPEVCGGEVDSSVLHRAMRSSVLGDCVTLEKALSIPPYEREVALGALSSLLESAESWTSSMNQMLLHQFNSLQEVTERQQISQHRFFQSVVAMLFFNLVMAAGLSFAFSWSFGRRVKELVEMAENIGRQPAGPLPARISDELDRVLDSLVRGAEQLSRDDQERERLISALTHDIRSPLQSICIVLSTLDSRLTKELVPAMPQAFVERSLEPPNALRSIRCALTDVLRQVDDLLTLQKLNAATVFGGAGKCLLNDICQEAIVAVDDLASRSDVCIELVDDNPGAALTIHGSHLQQLMATLLRVCVLNSAAHSSIEMRLIASPSDTFLRITAGGPALYLKRTQTNIIGSAAAVRDDFERALAEVLCDKLATLMQIELIVDFNGQNIIQLASASRI